MKVLALIFLLLIVMSVALKKEPIGFFFLFNPIKEGISALSTVVRFELCMDVEREW